MRDAFRGSPKKRSRRLLAGGLGALSVAGIGWLALPKPALLGDVTFSQAICDRHGTLLRVTRTPDDKLRLFTPLAEISPTLIDATLFQEDRYFRRHPGINPVSVASAARGLAGLGPARGGASTLTMQLARLRWRLQTRSALGKLTQMFRALQLERHYAKDQILEAYLNLAPYGGNVEGIGAASLLYHGKPAGGLSLPEAVALVTIPQSPARRQPQPGRANPALSAAHARLWSRLLAARPAVDPLGREFQLVPPPRPFLAPHFTAAVQRSAATGIVRTTLDLGRQEAMEQSLRTFIGTQAARRIRNAAALLIDTRTMAIRGQVGSADFSDALLPGQVDGTRQPRSPGSALKPFIYALALDQGLIHPLTLLSDAPRRFGDYDPENFDRAFIGPVRAVDALVRSRNVPAIELASKLRRPSFPGFLRAAGVRLPRADADYGLTLPLGGGEVTMQDLARLYASLTKGGEVLPLRRVDSEPAAAGARLLSPEAAFLTLAMLRENPPPAGHELRIAWKTGTSNGFRDAWAIGILGDHVLLTWVGNFDGSRNPAFVGRECAGPLLFQMIASLKRSGLRIAPEPVRTDLNVRRVDFCAVSGQLPSAACTHRQAGWFIPGISPIGACEIHQEVLVDAASGKRVPVDDGTRQLRREVYEFWPHDLRALFRQAGVPRRLPPPFLAETGRELSGGTAGAPRILSPRPDVIYLRRPETGNADGPAVVLRAQGAADATRIYWFADRAFVGVTAPLEPLAWRPEPGRYEVKAVDDQGRFATCSITLQAAR